MTGTGLPGPLFSADPSAAKPDLLAAARSISPVFVGTPYEPSTNDRRLAPSVGILL